MSVVGDVATDLSWSFCSGGGEGRLVAAVDQGFKDSTAELR